MIRTSLRVVHPALLAGTIALPAAAQSVERITVSSTGEAANNWVEVVSRPSNDGRKIAFGTSASNLVPGDSGATRDAFLRDRVLGTTTRIATNALSADLTPAGDLVAVFRTNTGVTSILDLVTNNETFLSAPPVVTSPGWFSANGRYLGYSRGDSTVPGPEQVWRRDIVNGTDDLVSATQAGTPNTVVALPGFLSDDGAIMTFTTADPNIVAGDGNARNDAFYKDYAFGFTDRISVDAFGGELPGDSSAGAISPDSRYFLFSTESPAVAGDTNGTWDLYVADRFLGELRRASVDSAGIQGNASSQSLWAWISQDGTRVIFDSLASNLVSGDTNGVRDIFEHDFSTNTTRRLVFGVGGVQVDQDVELRGVSMDGRYLTLVSLATNLVAGAPSTQKHAYIVDLGPQCFVASYCTANPNSTGVAAAIQSTGSPSFSVNNFVLSALDVPTGNACVFFHGTTRQDPPVPFGDGLRCVGGTVKRLGTLTASGGGAIQFQDLHSIPYLGVRPGETRRFQLLYRDSASTGAGFNTTAALEVTFCP